MKMYQNNGGENLRQANKTRFLGISGVFLNFFLRVQHNFKRAENAKNQLLFCRLRERLFTREGILRPYPHLSTRIWIFLKGGFFCVLKRRALTGSVFESFWPFHMKKLKRWAYDSTPCRACAEWCMTSSSAGNLCFRPSTRVTPKTRENNKQISNHYCDQNLILPEENVRVLGIKKLTRTGNTLLVLAEHHG